jgi:hypothetical protein
MANEWTSLEITQLVVDALMPMALLGLGLLVARNTRRLDALRHANQTVVARRLEVFVEVAPKLNKLLCFMAFVGRWKDITPTEALTLKREVDETMFTNRLLFSDELFAEYQRLMTRFFAMYATVDGDALIRARISSDLGDRRHRPWWSPAMAAMFARDDICEPADAQRAYTELSAAFREDLYVTDLSRPLSPQAAKDGSRYAPPDGRDQSINVPRPSTLATPLFHDQLAEVGAEPKAQ